MLSQVHDFGETWAKEFWFSFSLLSILRFNFSVGRTGSNISVPLLFTPMQEQGLPLIFRQAAYL